MLFELSDDSNIILWLVSVDGEKKKSLYNLECILVEYLHFRVSLLKRENFRINVKLNINWNIYSIFCLQTYVSGVNEQISEVCTLKKRILIKQ